MIDLTLLGSGGGMPMPNRHLSSLLISYMGRKILIDCGEGTQVAMRKMNTGFKAIDIICITHFHGDHIFGLPGLLSTIGNSDRTEPIIIIGPIGLTDVIKGLLVATYLPYSLLLVEDPKSSIEIVIESKLLRLKESNENIKSAISINTLELEHSSHCLGYNFYFPRLREFIPEKAIENNVPREVWKNLQREEEMLYNDKIYTPDMVLGEERKGIKISFITDTRAMLEIPDFIKDSNMFICEGTYGLMDDLDKAIKNSHMTFAEAALLAKEGNVDKLLLTHFSTAIDNPNDYINEATTIFRDSIIGYDGYKETMTFSK